MILEAKFISAGYRNHSVIREISHLVEIGRGIGVLGPHRSGKTTLLRALSRLIPCTAGNALH